MKIKHKLLFVFLLVCAFGKPTNAQTNTQEFIEALIGTWSLTAIVENTDSMPISEMPFEQELFIISQFESDAGEDTVFGKIIVDGTIESEGKIAVSYDPNNAVSAWLLDFPDSEPPIPVILDGNQFRIVNYLTVFHFARLIQNCSDLLPPVVVGDAILCPNESSVLSVQNAADFTTFQWYKRPYFPSGSPPEIINGATSSSYTVNANTDMLFYFSVEATTDSCTLSSNEVLIDQIVGLPPFVMQTGNFTIDNDGNMQICHGDTALFIINGMANIQWYNNNNPIPNAHDDTLAITTAGNYTATGTDNCNFPISLGVQIPVVVHTPVVPVISSDPTFSYIVNSSDFESVFWYYSTDSQGEYLPWTDEPTNDTIYVGCGDVFMPVKVTAIDSYGCSSSLEDYIGCLGLINDSYTDQIQLYPNPVQHGLLIRNNSNKPIQQIRIFNTEGKIIVVQAAAGGQQTYIDISQLPSGMYYCQLLLPDETQVYRPFVKQ